VPGKSLRAVLVEYGPGASSPSHRHPASAFIYATVLEGEIRSKVNDEPERVYSAGESWTEVPGDHHKVSANASSASLRCHRFEWCGREAEGRRAIDGRTMPEPQAESFAATLDFY